MTGRSEGSESISSKRRVKLSLAHQEPDRVPCDLGAVAITGITLPAYRNLSSHLGLPGDAPVERIRPQLVRVDEKMLDRFEIDTRGIFAEEGQDPGGEIDRGEDGTQRYEDRFGTTWKMPPNNPYFDIEQTMLEREGEKEVDEYGWPSPRDLVKESNLKGQVKNLDHEEYFIIMANTPTLGIFAPIPRLIGYNKFFKEVGRNPEYVCGFMDKLVELELEFFDAVLEEVGSYIDCLVEFDDLGGQNGPLISPEIYRKYVKPRHRKLFSSLQDKVGPSTPILFHSDGSVYEFIPDLIELGVDILNPVQYTAKGMELGRLKKEFGSNLSFWGAGANAQDTLPYGDPDEVEDEVKRTIDELAPGGGFVFSSIHNIQPEVPAENIVRMYDTAREYGRY